MSLAWWLRSMIQRGAQQKLREVVVQAATAGQEAAAEPGEPAKPVCHVGVVFALGIESGCFEDRLRGRIEVQGHGFSAVQGGLDGRGVVVVRCGPGAVAAAAATQALIDGHRPQWVISAGFSGGLKPDLKRGDIVMADSFVDLAGPRLSIDLKVDSASLRRARGVHVGRLLTVDHVVRTPQEKRELGQRFAALAVDMESTAVAEICRQCEQRFLAVRVISDAVDDELPADVERLLRKNTIARKVGVVAGAVVRRPSAIKDLWRLREQALLSADRLADFLSAIVVQLAPSVDAADAKG